MLKKIICFYFVFNFSNNISAQTNDIYIILTTKDSVYKWSEYDSIKDIFYRFPLNVEGTLFKFNKEQKILEYYFNTYGDLGNGTAVFFYPNGLVKEKGKFELGKDKDSATISYKTGIWYTWSDQGFLIKKEHWKKGVIYKTEKFKTISLK